jgi:tetratricopeptide (TPR) repeat protein
MNATLSKALNRNRALVAASVVLAVGAAWFSIPSENDLALMRFKAHQYEAALQVFERRVAEGDNSVAVVMPLVRIYLDQEIPDRAVAVMERYMAAQPHDARGRELLALAYQQAGQLLAYQQQLEILIGLYPTEERLHQLVQLYRHHGEADKRFSALEQLTTEYRANTGEWIDLAYLLLQRDDPRAAERALGGVEPEGLLALDLGSATTHFQTLLALGHVYKAADHLAKFAADPNTPAVLFNDLANHFVAQNLAEDGLKWFDYFRQDYPSATVERAWATLAATSGHDQQVIEWLASGADVDRPTLENLYHIAHDAHRPNLALASAERLFSKDAGHADRRRLATALLAAGHDDRALAHLRKLMPGDGQIESLYVSTLKRVGGTDELAAYVTARVDSQQATIDDRRKAAFELLAMGRREAAIGLFMELAQDASPDHSDVAELLFLWGPRPGSDALVWLETRVAGATGAERNVWLQYMLDMDGEAERVVRMIAAAGGPDGPAGLDIYLQALADSGQTQAIGPEVERHLVATDDPKRLRRYAHFTEYAGDKALTESIYELLLTATPDDRQALRWLGMHAMGREDYATAVAYLERYLSEDEGSFEANYALATALTQLDQESRAATYHRRALERTRMETVLGYDMRRAVAHSLDRLGRTDESIAAFESLRQERPDDLEMLGDYAAMLQQNGLFDRFRELVATR